MTDELLRMSMEELDSEEAYARPPAWSKGVYLFKVTSVESDWTDQGTDDGDERLRVRVGYTYAGQLVDPENDTPLEGRRFRQSFILPNHGDVKGSKPQKKLTELRRLLRAAGLEGWDPSKFTPANGADEEEQARAWGNARDALAEYAEEAVDLELYLNIDKFELQDGGEANVVRMYRHVDEDIEEVVL